ncbi:hypothetical protein [Chengkuizengella sediminis]|uniref:hypothetical protein n=1 Tax=Chengkuizengella sediminis TaxID=1885917 RepID=UPI001389512B|nr:hypothetical protein [Chengkuizengella sediminis]NDI33794.1 hypothetical protein [Chengkuizengella sediminis]
MLLWIFIFIVLFSFFITAIVISLKEDRKKANQPHVNTGEHDSEENFKNSAYINGTDYGSGNMS